MLELGDVADVLGLYAKALCGRDVELVGASPNRRDWGTPLDDGQQVRIGVPPSIGYGGGPRQDFDWYKVLITHQTGHLECDTAGFRMERPSVLFDDRRPRIAGSLPELLALFPDRQLGAWLFELCEDFRVDSAMQRRYAGLRRAYQTVREQSLAMRATATDMRQREAFLEELVRFSLGGSPAPVVGAAADIMAWLADPRATVEDAAEAALCLYDMAEAVPDAVLGEEPAEDHAREARGLPEGMPLMLPEAAAFRPPLDLLFPEGYGSAAGGEGAPEGEAGPLSTDGPGAYLYPEWDFRAAAYRRQWCRVHEVLAEDGTGAFYARALRDHRGLVADVRQRFQRLFPELFRKAPRRFDGEDFDLDSLVELVVDRRAGVTPSEKIYWRRERTLRDVAVAVLLDISATTSEYLAPEDPAGQRPAAASAADYSGYLRRIAQGVNAAGKPLRKQVIDVEREAVVVLMQALEQIGDAYALYAFSGSGRGDVRFLVAKDFDERLDHRAAKRLDRLEPAHATRMGAAIRHTIRKFGNVDAQTRLLVVVSDGRPYDRDYGNGEDDAEYAVRDTRQALEEARDALIRPFCLTVDASGADYLQGMCAGLPYEVVERVEELPERLLAAYPRLTA